MHMPLPPTPSVLLVEPHADTREMMRLCLELNGFHMREAEDALDGLRQAAASPPDAVLTEVWLPVLDGFDFVTRLRAERATASTPVLALTSYTGPDLLARIVDVGIDDVLVKPFDIQELVGAVAELAYLGRPPRPHLARPDIRLLHQSAARSAARRACPSASAGDTIPQPYTVVG